MSQHCIGLTQRYHCSQNAVIGSQSPCPYVENALVLDGLVNSIYCHRGQQYVASRKQLPSFYEVRHITDEMISADSELLHLLALTVA